MDILEEAARLTPVEEHGGLFLKRDDMFAPFGTGVNGGKLRQCALLMSKNLGAVERGVVTATSILSPQAPIVASLAEYYGTRCTVMYGGTTLERVLEMPYPRYAKERGATVRVVSRCARTSAIQAVATQRVRDTREFNVRYGMDLMHNLDVFIGSTAAQVANLPDELPYLVLTCGSAITSIGVMLGLAMHKKKVRDFYLVGVAPNRCEKIAKYANAVSLATRWQLDMRNIRYIDAQAVYKGYLYENTMEESFDGVTFHPRYEAKTFHWLRENLPLDIGGAMWVTGGEIK